MWSAEGTGSTFTLRLPVAAADAKDVGDVGGTDMTRILVVEDEESFRDALSYMLRQEGFEVELADSGPSAVEQFDRHGADLVLLDLMLPGLPGTEVCRALRAKVGRCRSSCSPRRTARSTRWSGWSSAPTTT